MSRKIVTLALFLLILTPFAAAQGLPARLTGVQIDETRRTLLRGNMRPEARPEFDRGLVADDLPLEHMLLQLKRTPQQDLAVQHFIDEQQTLGSPNYHRWLTAQEFGARFGLAKQDLDVIRGWLESHGFSVNVVYASGMLIDFSGTARQVRAAFHTEIHALDVHGAMHFANISDPQIPTALADAVSGVVSLHDFRPHAMHHLKPAQADFTFPSVNGTLYAVSPADLDIIYNLNPALAAGFTGKGQTIALIEDTDLFSNADWTRFRSAFGLSGYTSGSLNTVHPAPATGPNNCSPPGVVAPDDAEAILDAEWASAAAPDAAIVMATCANTATTFGGFIAIQNLLNGAAAPPPVMSLSYGECETMNGQASNIAFLLAFEQAAAMGVSVFVSSGDSGAAGCDNNALEATHGIGANAFASSLFNVAVGGTDFADTFAGVNSTYWNSTNTLTFGSVRSYVPEIPWNDSCAGLYFANYVGYPVTFGDLSLCNDPTIGSLVISTVAGGGAPSACAVGAPSTPGVVSGTCAGWPKPWWQGIVLGNPADGVRDTPDVSLFAADGLWGHFYPFCWSDTANGGASCSGDPSTWAGGGGTSFASPIMAGFQSLINQYAGSAQGNPTFIYYIIAFFEYGNAGNIACDSFNGAGIGSSCYFYDISHGDIDVDCVGNANCFLPSGSVGVLSTSSNAYQPAYVAGTGWDFATGIGSVNASQMILAWPTPNFSISASPATITVARGSSASTVLSLKTWNGFSSAVTLSASGLPSGVTATFTPPSTSTTSTLKLTATSTATTGTTNVTITATGGGVTHTTTLAVTVQ